MVAVLHPTGLGSQIVIDRAVVLVGRSADCDAIIDFSSKISRFHCVFVQVDADYYIRDLGSMNGVRVNGQRVEKSVKLFQGAEVAIGDVFYQFHANVQPAPRVAIRTHGGAKGIASVVDKSAPILDAEIFDAEIIDAQIIDAQIIDAQILEDADLVEDVQVVDVIQDVEIVDDLVEVVEFVDEIEVIDVIDDVDVIEDVQIVSDEIRRPRSPPRLR